MVWCFLGKKLNKKKLIFSPLSMNVPVLFISAWMQIIKRPGTWSWLKASTLLLQRAPNKGIVLASPVSSASDTAEWKEDSKWGYRQEAALCLSSQSSMNHWGPQDPKGQWSSSQSVAEATTCYWQKLGCRSVSSSAIFLIDFTLGTHLEAARVRLSPFSVFRQSCSSATSLLILISPSSYWSSIRLRGPCLLLPCQSGFSLSLRNITGCEPAQMGGEQLLFAKLGA